MTLTLDVAAATGLIGLLVAVAGVIGALFKLWARFGRLEKQAAYRQEDTSMTFKCLRACLEGMKQQGCNGTVTETLNELNTYTSSRAAGLGAKR